MMYLPLDKIMERQNQSSSSLPMNATQNALDGLRNQATPNRDINTRPSSAIRGESSRTGR
jgi:hypothetical protein